MNSSRVRQRRSFPKNGCDPGSSENKDAKFFSKRQFCVWKLKTAPRGILAARCCGEAEFSSNLAVARKGRIFDLQSRKLDDTAFCISLFVAFQRGQSDQRFARVGTVNRDAIMA